MAVTMIETSTSVEAPLAALTGDPFDALGDPNRRAIVELLGGGDRSVQELANERAAIQQIIDDLYRDWERLTDELSALTDGLS